MGPYIFPVQGIRIDHFVIYIVSFFLILKNIKVIIYKKKMAFIQIFILTFLFLITIFFSRTFTTYSYASIFKVFADLDNYLQPILITLFIYICTKNLNLINLKELFIFIYKTISFLLIINTFLAISSIFFGPWFIEYFNTSGNVEEGVVTVFDIATRGGRFSGIYNQPIEAGVSFGIMLITTTYIFYQRKLSKFNISIYFLSTSLIFIFIGGILSVSKVFFPLSFFISFLLFIFYNKNRFLNIAKTFLSLLIILLILVFTIFSQWEGSDYFLRLIYIAEDQDLISLYTADRFGGDNVNGAIISSQLKNPDLILGLGFGSIQTPDNAYLEILYFGGYFALLVYFLSFILLIYFTYKYYMYDKDIAIFLFSILFFILAAGLGAPIFGMNRSNIFLITIFVISFIILYKKRLIYNKIEIN
jgi:hypothetical protein